VAGRWYHPGMWTPTCKHPNLDGSPCGWCAGWREVGIWLAKHGALDGLPPEAAPLHADTAVKAMHMLLGAFHARDQRPPTALGWSVVPGRSGEVWPTLEWDDDHGAVELAVLADGSGAWGLLSAQVVTADETQGAWLRVNFPAVLHLDISGSSEDLADDMHDLLAAAEQDDSRDLVGGVYVWT